MENQVDELCGVIHKVLLELSNGKTLSEPISAESKMGSPSEWDSLGFVSVFLAVTQHFKLDVDDDDAIHFTSVPSILEFIQDY